MIFSFWSPNPKSDPQHCSGHSAPVACTVLIFNLASFSCARYLSSHSPGGSENVSMLHQDEGGIRNIATIVNAVQCHWLNCQNCNQCIKFQLFSFIFQSPAWLCINSDIVIKFFHLALSIWKIPAKITDIFGLHSVSVPFSVVTWKQITRHIKSKIKWN